MTPAALTKLLLDARRDEDQFQYDTFDIVAKLERQPPTAPLIQAIPDFMEGNPALDYGTSSPLARYMEHLPEYGALVEDSVTRAPTVQTLIMLWRVINGTPTEPRRSQLMEVLRKTAVKRTAEREVNDLAAYILGQLEGAE